MLTMTTQGVTMISQGTYDADPSKSPKWIDRYQERTTPNVPSARGVLRGL
jgi:hypothetical protein